MGTVRYLKLEEVKEFQTRGGPGGDPTNKHFYEHAVASEPKTSGS